MLSGVFFPRRSRKRRERCIREFVADVNAGRHERMANFITEDFAYVDVSGHRTSSREEFLRMDREFREAAGNPQVQIDTLDHNGDEVLVRGQLTGGAEEVRGQTFWRISFDGDRIRRADVTRADGHITMPVFASRTKV